MRLALCTTAALLLSTSAWAGEFGAAGQSLDDSLADFDARVNVIERQLEIINQRLNELEEGPTPPPPEICRVAVVEAGQEPLAQHCLPTRIQAEDYDLGGEGVAYHDLDAENKGGLYRDRQGVDVYSTGDVDGDFQVGSNRDGEWLEYTVKGRAGVYDLDFRVACGAALCGRVRAVLDGKVLGTVQVPPTGGWQGPYETVTLECISARDGNQTLRLEMLDTWLDLNWVEFRLRDTPGNDPPCDLLFDD